MNNRNDRANPSGIVLTDEDASMIKGMILRGDRNHDIASFFGVNPARIAEIKKLETFSHVKPITAGLPPPGPYLQAKEALENGR